MNRWLPVPCDGSGGGLEQADVYDCTNGLGHCGGCNGWHRYRWDYETGEYRMVRHNIDITRPGTMQTLSVYRPGLDRLANVHPRRLVFTEEAPV